MPARRTPPLDLEAGRAVGVPGDGDPLLLIGVDVRLRPHEHRHPAAVEDVVAGQTPWVRLQVGRANYLVGGPGLVAVRTSPPPVTELPAEAVVEHAGDGERHRYDDPPLQPPHFATSLRCRAGPGRRER